MKIIPILTLQILSSNNHRLEGSPKKKHSEGLTYTSSWRSIVGWWQHLDQGEADDSHNTTRPTT
jgi:hypothetical protein